MGHPADWPISEHERSGVLHPSNLCHFDARWISPAPELLTVVDTYWTVAWDIPDGHDITQRIIDFPAVTLSIEEQDATRALVISAVHPGAWQRTIRGRGKVFAMRLRPAGVACLTDLRVGGLAPEQPLTASLDRRSHALLMRIRHSSGSVDGPEAADHMLGQLLAERPPTDHHLLGNAVIDVLVKTPVVRPMQQVADELGVSQRTMQRVLDETLGMSPSEVARRIRLQEVVRRQTIPGMQISAVASSLGYADQAHLTNEFGNVTGITPGRYFREAAGPAQT